MNDDIKIKDNIISRKECSIPAFIRPSEFIKLQLEGDSYDHSVVLSYAEGKVSICEDFIIQVVTGKIDRGLKNFQWTLSFMEPYDESNFNKI